MVGPQLELLQLLVGSVWPILLVDRLQLRPRIRGGIVSATQRFKKHRTLLEVSV